jgi:hypothetical protein
LELKKFHYFGGSSTRLLAWSFSAPMRFKSRLCVFAVHVACKKNDAFQYRIAPVNVVPEGILTDNTTLRDFWSRANVQELGLWTESHDFVVAELARHIDATMQVSAVMGCVTEFTVDASKIEVLRVGAGENQYQEMINQRLEITLDAVFTKQESVTLWCGLEGDEPSNVSSKGLTSALQFSDTGLLADVNGLDSTKSERLTAKEGERGRCEETCFLFFFLLLSLPWPIETGRSNQPHHLVGEYHHP